MLIAEDLLLLLTDDHTGKACRFQHHGWTSHWGGALLVELALIERVDVAGPAQRGGAGTPRRP